MSEHNHTHHETAEVATIEPAKNFDAAARLAHLKSLTPAHLQNKEMTFNFKKDPTTGIKRNKVVLTVPVPTSTGLLEALEDQKIQDYILDLVANAVGEAVREQVNADVKPVNADGELDLSKLTLEFLANQPKSDRRGNGIAKEVWEAFGQDYANVMAGILTTKTPEQIAAAAKLLMAKFAPIKFRKALIETLQSYLAMWFEATKQQEEFADVFEFLGNKAEELLGIDPNEYGDLI